MPIMVAKILRFIFVDNLVVMDSVLTLSGERGSVSLEPVRWK